MKPSTAFWIGIASVLVVGVLVAWNGAQPASCDEPLVLRWARIAAQHPVRTGIALALLISAACPTRPPASASNNG
jgi:hypothetical protein